jgi:hypothetical protein
MEIRIDVNPGADIGAAIAAAIPSLRRSDGDYGGRIVLPRGQFFCSPVRVPPFNFGETRVVIEGEGGGTMLRPHPSTAAGEYLFHIGGRTEIKGIDFSNPDHRPVNAIRLFGVDQTSDNGPAFTEVTYCQFRQFGTAIRNENLGNWASSAIGSSPTRSTSIPGTAGWFPKCTGIRSRAGAASSSSTTDGRARDETSATTRWC